MKSRITAIFLIVLFTVFGFNSGYILAQSPLAPVQLFAISAYTPDEVGDSFAPFWEVWELLNARYVNQPLDDEALVEGAIEGMLATLDDPNTRYLSPEANEAAIASLSGQFEGIGAEIIDNEEGGVTIVAPIEGSPAAAAGLRPGDIIRAADGIDLTNMSTSEVVSLVRGPAGTAVVLTVDRDGDLFDVEIIRDVIKTAGARGELLAEGIGYVRITRFGNSTADELRAVLNDLMPQNPSGLIIDVRGNPGGSLETVVQIADEFLPEGLILSERFGDKRRREHFATNEGLAEEVPLVVLIDEGSASASEVLAGAIRDQDRGVLIGQTSFGKGTVQSWQDLSNGGGVRITVAQWLTPNDTWIHENGLTPDYFIPLPAGESFADIEDTQLAAAVDFLQGETIISVPPAPNES